MFLYNYRCAVHGEFDGWSRMENREKPKPCPECDGPGYRVVTAINFKLEGLSGHFPTAADKWATFHEKEGKKESSD